MSDSSQDRRLPATPRRIEKARGEGQVPRSRDLGHFAALAAIGLLVFTLAPQATRALQRMLSAALTFDSGQLVESRLMLERLGESSMEFVQVAGVCAAVLLLVAVASGLASGGWVFSWTAVRPSLAKLDPIQGLGRLLSPQQVGQAMKACAAAVCLASLAAWHLASGWSDFARGLSMDLPASLALVSGKAWNGALVLLAGMALLALIDVPLQRLLWMRRLRMSHEELKQEHKEAEGNTEVKARIRARMREMANKRMLAAVPHADLVVMNPTHFAVALRYDERTMKAPRVVAKGADLMALRIRDAAKSASVPVLQAPPLARALYAHTEVDREIPAALFGIVAQVLAWVYQLRTTSSGLGGSIAPPEIHVPPELDPLHHSSAMP